MGKGKVALLEVGWGVGDEVDGTSRREEARLEVRWGVGDEAGCTGRGEAAWLEVG